MTEFLVAFGVLWDARVALVLAMGLAAWLMLGWNSRRAMLSFFLLALPILLVLYLPAVFSYLAGLSTDSLAELTAPDWRETTFYFSTLGGLIQPLDGHAMLLSVAIVAAVAGSAAWVSMRLRHNTRTLSIARWLLGLFMIGLTVAQTLRLAVIYVEADHEIASIRENFRNKPPVESMSPRPLHVVVYIGESTTAANMQLYGYPRATTPKLSARMQHDSGLLRFDDVLSTHTHTSPSLMDALSFRIGNELVPIYERRYYSLVGMLRQFGVQTALISNQGRHGTWNIGGAVVFADVGASHFSVNSRALGNSELRVTRPFDDDLFASELPRLWKPGSQPQVVFLHSYAGHGPYLRNIPEEYRNWSDDFDRISSSGWVGDRLFNADAIKQSVLEYDRAVRYIDASVESVLSFADTRPEPTVTLYFSDHGESPWTGRGHDSSNLLFEMLRVPMLIHFNAEARQNYPALFERFRSAASERRIRTLDEIAPTVVELLGMEVESSFAQSLTAPHGPGSSLLLLRRLNNALGGVLAAEREAPKDMVDLGDLASHLFRENRLRTGTRLPMLCHHRANTFGRARRAAISSGCMEFDVAPGRADIEVFHLPKTASGLRLTDMLEVAARANMSIWIDTKDLPTERCQELTDKLKPVFRMLGEVLIELPPNLSVRDGRLSRCVSDWRELGAAVAYYVPTATAKACAGLGGEERADRLMMCEGLRAKIAEVRRSGWITDLSLDAAGLSAVTSLPDAQTLRLNLWGLSLAQAKKVNGGSYRFLLIDSEADPNGY